MYNSLSISKYFVRKALETKTPITPYKLEFLVYFAHGWYLAIDGRCLIDEKIEAWKHGPVIVSMNRFYKDKKNLKKHSSSEILKESVQEFLNGIWAYYGHLNEVEMQSLCLEHNTPWDLSYKKSSGHLVIDNEVIKKHYKLLHLCHPEFCDEDDPISVVA
mgnify:CR=1 FL=1